MKVPDEKVKNSSGIEVKAKNWVTLNKVTPVKNQGQCGSCWDFSAVGAMESLSLIRDEVYSDFSEQQVLDCANYQYGYNAFGCGGGYPWVAFSYIKAHGLAT